MKRDYDSLISSGVKAQIEKLNMNEHKKGFEDVDLKYAYKRIKQETRELWKEIYWKPFIFMLSGMFVRHYIWHRDVRKEAADIANFAHMIIYKCDQEINK